MKGDDRTNARADTHDPLAQLPPDQFDMTRPKAERWVALCYQIVYNPVVYTTGKHMRIRPFYADEAVPDGYEVYSGIEAMPESVWNEVGIGLVAEVRRQGRPAEQPDILMVSDGPGRHSVQCRACWRPSPMHDRPDGLRMLAKAKEAGWAVAVVGDDYWTYCENPRCQKRPG